MRHWDETHDSREVFRALLAAINSPGHPIELPDVPVDPVSAVLLTLVDDTTPLAMDPECTVARTLATHVPLELVPLDEARFVWFDGDAGGVLDRLPTGAPDAPELGATVVLAADGPTSVTLSGPGLAAETVTLLPLSAEALRARAAAIATPPFGIDLLVVDADSRTVVSLPRSTSVVIR